MKVIIKNIDEMIEEEVTVIIGGIELVCFAGVCPYEIEVGKEYLASISMFFFDEYCVEEVSFHKKEIKRINDSFQYNLFGKIDGGSIDCGLVFEDEFISFEYGYLDGLYVKMTVDRIDITFI